MKNLCCFLRQNIVQKPSIASIKEEHIRTKLFMSIDKCIKSLLYSYISLIWGVLRHNSKQQAAFVKVGKSKRQKAKKHAKNFYAKA